MNGLKSLSELIKTLMHSDAEDYVKIAKGMNIPIEDFKKYAYFKEDGYSRNCIVKTDDFELILICWKKNDITPIHCHNDQKCWVYQVEGNMTEIRYDENDLGELKETNQIDLSPGDLCYMQDSMGFHLLKNQTNENAMTLHLYIKPVSQCNVYNPEEKAFELRELSFDTVDGVQENS